jgi:general secretion pathway protein D
MHFMSVRIRTLLLALILASCAATPTYRANSALEEGRALVQAGNLEQGLARLQEEMARDPRNQELRTYYFRVREAAVQRYLALADSARASYLFDEAEKTYRHVLTLDPANPRAQAGIEQLGADRRHRALLLEGEELFRNNNVPAAQLKARAILAENSSHREALSLLRRAEAAAVKAPSPQLTAALKKPVTLEFRDATVRSVFELLSKNSGLNFIFDRDVPADLRTTVFVRDTTVEDVIRFVLVTSQLESKVLNDNTMLIYPNTPAKAQSYRELVVRNFYLENADVKRTADMIKALVKTRDMHVDEKLNLIVIRDTAEAVRLAERLIANQDLAEPEVMLEVEVLEVAANLSEQIGIQWPSQLGIGVVGAAGTPGTITLPEWLNRNSGLVRLTVSDPLFLFNLRKQDGTTNILANPRIRVKNREKARVHIGDRVPVITTTTTATGFVAESVNYLDVGLKLEVEPNIYLENDVGIRVGLEVSSITGTERSPAGTLTYRVGTRNANTVLRLRDGETQVLAGLISDEDRSTATKVPGLGDAPVVGRLFSNNSDTKNKTEIMLLITPRVVRNIVRPELRMEEYSSGTDAAVGAAPLSLKPVPGAASAGPAPSPGPAASPVPAAPAAPQK